jgi:hypothetical protein
MLDPIKFGIVCPGMKPDGKLDDTGIPADIVTAYLDRHGIVPSRTTDHMVLFLFSVGITKGKWGTLLNVLLDFKNDYDANAPLAQILPDLVRGAPATRNGTQGSGRRVVGPHEEEPAGTLAGAGLRQLPNAEDDAAAGLPAPDGRRCRGRCRSTRWRTAWSRSA